MNATLIHLFIVHPLIVFLLHNPKQFTQQQRYVITGCFAFLVSMAMLLNQSEDDPELNFFASTNYFNALKVRRDCTSAEIKKSYRVLSKEVHPDHNPDNPNANEMFMNLQTAYTVLVNDEFRVAYDKFGRAGVLMAEKNADIFQQGMTNFIASILGLLVMTFCITIRSSHTSAWSWSLVGLGLLAAIEFGAKFGSLNISNAPLFIANYTTYQLCALLHEIYPIYVHIITVVQTEMYVDTEELFVTSLQLLHFQTIQIHQSIQDLKLSIKTMKRQVGAGVTTSDMDEQPSITPNLSVTDDSASNLSRAQQARVMQTVRTAPERRQNMIVGLWNSIPGTVKTIAFMAIIQAMFSSGGSKNEK